MTREEAIKVLNTVDENASCDDCLYYNQMEDCPTNEDCIIRQALWMAISALEQLPEVTSTMQTGQFDYVRQPCEDAVSRDAVLDALLDYWHDIQFVDGSGYDVYEDCKAVIDGLPSVTQKSGKWIKIKSGDKDFPESIVCSRCSNENSHLDFNENAEPIGKVFVTSKFCPNCGARMFEPKESGVSE